MLTIRADCERINGRYTNAEYRRKINRCDLTLNTGPYGGGARGCIQNRAEFHQKLSLHP